jgi:hypothetical protein
MSNPVDPTVFNQMREILDQAAVQRPADELANEAWVRLCETHEMEEVLNAIHDQVELDVETAAGVPVGQLSASRRGRVKEVQQLIESAANRLADLMRELADDAAERDVAEHES